MSESDQVINIERDQNISIEVYSSPTVSAVETVTEERVLVGWKRIILGVSLISAMLIPLLGGTIVSYFLRNDLHAPVDPYNIWPDTVYRGQINVNYFVSEDKGFNEWPNNHLLIKNGKKDYFTVSYDNNADVYIAVYLVENLYSYEGLYTLHVVSSTDKSDLSPSFDLTLMKDHSYLNQKMKHYWANSRVEYFQPPGVCLAGNLADRFGYVDYVKYADQNEAMTAIATRINEILKSNPKEFYYPTSKKTGSYIFSGYSRSSGFNNEMFYQLVQLRNSISREHFEKELTNKKSPKAAKIVMKPKFKKIVMESLSD